MEKKIIFKNKETEILSLWRCAPIFLRVKNSQFGTVVCDYYGNRKGEFFVTRQQIGQALEYANPNRDIDTLHRRHKEKLDKFSTTVTLRVVEGTRNVNREMLVYSAKGVYEICRWSRQPKADAFYDHVEARLRAGMTD